MPPRGKSLQASLIILPIYTAYQTHPSQVVPKKDYLRSRLGSPSSSGVRGHLDLGRWSEQSIGQYSFDVVSISMVIDSCPCFKVWQGFKPGTLCRVKCGASGVSQGEHLVAISLAIQNATSDLWVYSRTFWVREMPLFVLSTRSEINSCALLGSLHAAPGSRRPKHTPCSWFCPALWWLWVCDWTR